MQLDGNLVRTGRIATEGDDLYYEVRGDGPPLLMIPGGGGDAGFFTAAAGILSEHYQVITYDRRGNSRSSRNEPQHFDISQQSRDAVAVLRANGHESAFIFGNSGGGVIVLDMAKTQPGAVRVAVAHEAPILTVLPDAQKWRRRYASYYATARYLGHQLAMLRFALSVRLPKSAYGAVPIELAQRMKENHAFFVMQEMIPFASYVPDVAAIRANQVALVLSTGEWTLSQGLYYGRPGPILSRQIGCPFVPLPGNHLSYLDCPDRWAAALRDVLERPVATTVGSHSASRTDGLRPPN